MIVRVLNDGQYTLSEAAVAELNSHDDEIEAAVAADDQARLTQELTALIARIKEIGEPLPEDSLEDSDLIIPDAESTVEEVHTWLGDSGSTDGLIPGRAN